VSIPGELIRFSTIRVIFLREMSIPSKTYVPFDRVRLSSPVNGQVFVYGVAGLLERAFEAIGAVDDDTDVANAENVG